MERNYDPVIIFSFSKRECETLSLQMNKLDLTSPDEKKVIDTIFNNAMDALNDDDRRLPQVVHMLPLLRRGIGVHHSGLLPIIKEARESGALSAPPQGTPLHPLPKSPRSRNRWRRRRRTEG